MNEPGVETGERITRTAQTFFGNDTEPIGEAVLSSATQLYLQTIRSRNHDGDHSMQLPSDLPRLDDCAVVIAALFHADSAWQEILQLAESHRGWLAKTYGESLGSVSDDVVNDAISHFQASGKRSDVPNFRMRLASYQGKASLKSWIRTVLTNRILDQTRKPAMKELQENREALSMNDEIRAEIQAAIERLPPKQRVLCRLLFIYEEKQTDVAALMDVTPAAVSQAKAKLLAELKSILGGQPESQLD